MYERILIPTDGSSWSEAAIPHGLYLARQLGLPVIFLHVLEETLPPQLAFSPALLSQQALEEFERRLQQAGQEVLARALKLAHEAKVTAESKLVRGIPASAILEEAKRTDLLVMGTHGRSGWAAVFLGSVTMHVLHRVCCPVVAVPSHSRTTKDAPQG